MLTKDNIEFETVTPEIAASYLSHNLANRKVKKATVERYARDLLRGKFETTHQGIAFDADGTLLDGQHRLMAIASTGVPARLMVTRYTDKNASEYIDRGTSRSVRDVISIGDMKGYAGGDSMLSNQRLISALNQLVSCTTPKKIKTSVSDIRALMQEFYPAATSVYQNLLTKSKITARAPMFAAAIAAVSCGVDADAVSKFFQIVFCDDVTGCDGFNVNAALNWKRQVEQAKAARVQIDRRKLYRGTQNAIYHFVNNTGVNKILAPADCRYDVAEKVERALSAQ